MRAHRTVGFLALALGAGGVLSACRSTRLSAPDAPVPLHASASDVAAGLGRPEPLQPRELGTAAARAASDDLAFAAPAGTVPGTPPAPGATPPAGDAGGGGDLAAKSADPTQPLLTYSVNAWYSPSSHGLTSDEDWTTLAFRAVVPFRTGCVQQIARFHQPVLADAPGDVQGVGDLTVFNLAVFKGRGFTWGIGADLTIPWGSEDVTSHRWSAGPAGVIMVPAGKWLFGALMQNYFSFAGGDDGPDVAQTVLQPIVVYALGKGRTVGLSELLFVYDWEKGAWTSAPFGLSFAQIVKVGGQPVKLSLAADYNFIDDYVAPDWTLRLGVALILP